jgi:uncharacterized membrane protein YdfJ with MMPL/SSD domain
MTIATRVFLVAMAFGFAVACAYWLVAREPVGTFLLGLFGGGLAWDSGYLLVTRGRTPVDGDTSLAPAQLAGERIGVFSLESPWPVLLALTSAGTLIGAVLHPFLGACSFLAMLWLIWRMVLESV